MAKQDSHSHLLLQSFSIGWRWGDLVSSVTGRAKDWKPKSKSQDTELTPSGQGGLPFHAGTLQEHPRAHWPASTLRGYRRAGSSAPGCGNCWKQWGRVGLLHPELLDGFGYFGGSQGLGGDSRWACEHQWFPVKGLHCVEADKKNCDFQHLVYLLGSGKQKKQQGLVSRNCQYHTHSAAPLPNEMFP